ncbi:MAG: hypothetical protein N3A69_06250 [Leptospiraceae bacterium]|nr:hypothetical protein [Leptospiraceae bacterium]
MLKFFLLFFYVFLFTLRAEEKVIKINKFEPKDLSNGIFSVELVASSSNIFEELCKVETIRESQNSILTDCDFSLKLGSRVMGFLLDSFLWNGVSLKFDASYKKSLPSGKALKLRLLQGNKLLDEETIFIPQTNEMPPSISKIFPVAGARGYNIKVHGRNFGENLDKIKIIFLHARGNDRQTRLIEVGRTYPNYVTSPNSDGTQELQFTIPENLEVENKITDLLEPIQIKIYASFQEAYYESQEALEFQLLNSNWKWSLFGTSFVILFIFYLLVAIYFKNLFWIRYLYVDKTVNKLSLSMFEFTSWSAIFIFTLVYMFLFYLSFNQISNLLKWENSLFALCLVIYVPIIISLIMDKIYPKNELSFTPPSFTDLIFSKGSLDVMRLQLLGFSIFTKFLFLYILFTTNFFETSLEVPYHFVGFLGASRFIYLVSKFFQDEVAIQNVLPLTWSNEQLPIQLTLLGHGFQDGQKIQIGNSFLYELMVHNSKKAEVTWKEKLSLGIHPIFIHSKEGEISRTLPCIKIQKNPVEPKPPAPRSVSESSVTSSNSK